MPEIKHGTEEVTRYIMIVDSADGTPELDIDVTTLDMQYTRAGAAPAAKVDAASLGATDAAWDDNEIFQVDKLASPGLYRVDWPNAAFAAGVDSVLLVVSGTGFAPAVEEITLIANRADDNATAIAAVKAETVLIVADTNELQADDYPTSIAAIKAETALIVEDTNELQVDDYPTSIAAIKAETALIVEDTSELQVDDYPTSIAAIKAETALIVADTNELQTDNVPGLIAALNNVSPANLATALTNIGLDHLVAVAVADEVVDNSIIAKIAAAGGDWSDFVTATDALQAIRDNQTAPTVFQGTSTASSTTSKVFVQAGDTPATGADDDYNNTIIAVYDGADKTTSRVNIRVVEDYDDSDPSFTVSPALSFTPGAGDYVEIYAADGGALAMLVTLSSGFATSSPNRLIDHLRSIMSKAAVTPASVGTYDPATDSLEHLGESADLMAGAGFATGTDSLKEIRDAIDVLVAPSVVGSSALSGSGFLSDCVSLIRKAVDEPSANPKYTDGDIVELLQVAIDQVLTDISIATDHPVIVRHSITLVDGVQDYILPPQVGELLRIAKLNTTTGLPEYEEYPGSHMNPSGSGWKIEGNILRLLRDFHSTNVMELMYTPNAEPLIHKGTSEAETATTIKLMAIPTDGTLGKRPNEYVGMTLRIISSTENIKEERVITAYNVTTRVATVNKAWDTTPTGTVVYEVVPVFGRLVKHVCVLRAAIDLLSNEGNSQRMTTLERNYMLKMSAMRRAISKKEGRFPHHFDGDTWDNPNRLGY